MKVLAVTPLYPPASRVGAWLATHGCLAHLASVGHQVDVVPFMAGGWAYDLDGVHVHPGASLEAFRDPDVVISHLGDNQAASRYAAQIGVPSVRMVHGSNPANADNLTANPCDLAVFNSLSLAAEIEHPGPSIVVRPPFDPDSVRATPGTKTTLVNLSEPKGGAVFWRLAKSMPDVQFLGVRGCYGEQVSNKAKNTTVIPPTQHMRDDVYARTRILLMPSSSETWGMTGLEAMCSGIPVIAHPTPGLQESLGDAATFVDRDDLKGWQAAIRHLMSPSAWTAASAAARAHADRYSPAGDLARFTEAITDLALVPA